MGTLPGLLPGGRPVSDAAARVDMAAAWGADAIPQAAGRDTSAILAATAAGDLRGLVIGGLELADLPDPAVARAALDEAAFIVSLEVRLSDVTEFADIVFPVAPPAEKAGAFWNWEGRIRSFRRVLESSALSDHRVLDAIAQVMGVELGLGSLEATRAEIEQLEAWGGARMAAPSVPTQEPTTPSQGQAVLAGWRMLLDCGRLQDGEAFLAGTAKQPVARLSAATAAAMSAGPIAAGDLLKVATEAGSITLPVVITDMPDHVVWLPLNSPGSRVRAALGAGPGDIVQLTHAESTVALGSANTVEGQDA
jgi:NADH-quinone oxidoreductase subunit G